MKRDQSYLKDCPIAVLGAGAVGMTLAADCKLGQPEREVRLYSRSKKSKAYMDKTGIQMDGIQRNLYAFERSGRAHLDMYTNDMAEAVKGAKFILMSIPALAQDEQFSPNDDILDGKAAINDVVASWDPNEMVGPAGVGEGHYLGQTQTVSYRILFENKAEAGDAAYRVRISDELDEDVFDVSYWEQKVY